MPDSTFEHRRHPIRQAETLAAGRDTEGRRLVAGLRYLLYADGMPPMCGGLFAIWSGSAFLDDVTGIEVDLCEAGYSLGMLIPPGM